MTTDAENTGKRTTSIRISNSVFERARERVVKNVEEMYGPQNTSQMIEVALTQYLDGLESLYLYQSQGTSY
jgi:hypothetical protein